MKSLVVVMSMMTLTLLSQNSMAITVSGWRTIVDMGCHTVDSICFLTLSGAAVGPAQCSQPELRWNQETMPNAKAFFAQMTAAFLAGRQVNIAVHDICYADWPTPYFYHIAS